MKGMPREKYQVFTNFGLTWTSEKGELHFEIKDDEGKLVKIHKYASREFH